MINSRKIKARMVEKGLTQKDIANVMGIRTPTVSQKINNIRPMYLKEAEKIVEALEIPLEDFSLYFFSN